MVSVSHHRWATVLLWVGLTTGCNAIIGIEESRLDPLIEEPVKHQVGTNEPAAQEPDAADAGERGDALVDDADAESLCATYCRTVMESCTGAAAVYATVEVCLATCARLPEGIPGDQIGNSVQCRLENAELARATGELSVHCPVAGPGGNGVCGSDCEAYCLLFESACATHFQEGFLGLPDCVEQCRTLPSANTYDVSFTAGDTLQCRLYHVGAATLDPNRHCSHAAGGPPCID